MIPGCFEYEYRFTEYEYEQKETRNDHARIVQFNRRLRLRRSAVVEPEFESQCKQVLIENAENPCNLCCGFRKSSSEPIIPVKRLPR